MLADETIVISCYRSSSDVQRHINNNNFEKRDEDAGTNFGLQCRYIAQLHVTCLIDSRDLLRCF